MKELRATKTFLLTDYRDQIYNGKDCGFDITAGNGDGLYMMDITELRELHDLVGWAISYLEQEKTAKNVCDLKNAQR